MAKLTEEQLAEVKNEVKNYFLGEGQILMDGDFGKYGDILNGDTTVGDAIKALIAAFKAEFGDDEIEDLGAKK